MAERNQLPYVIVCRESSVEETWWNVLTRIWHLRGQLALSSATWDLSGWTIKMGSMNDPVFPSFHTVCFWSMIMLVSFKFSTILPLSLSSLTLTPALTASYQMYHYQRQRAKCFIFYFFSKIHSLNSFIAIPLLNPSLRSEAPKIARGPGLSQRRTRRPRPPLRTAKTHPDADDSNEDLRLARIMSETRNW